MVDIELEKRIFVQRIPPPIWLLISLLSMMVLHLYIPVRGIVPVPFNLGGLAFVVVSLLFFGKTVRRFLRARTTIIPFRESSTLITTGMFRFSRNPIYLSMVLLLLGVAVLFGSVTPFSVVVAFAVLIDRVFIAGEERMLRTTFADEYETYCRRVRRWI